MKIGVLTFHHSENFGAVLQALALQSLLAEWGHEVCILNHARHHAPFWTRWRDSHGKLSKPADRLRGLLHQLKYTSEFDRFRRESFRLTRFFSNPRALAVAAQHLDAIITGSDQVWHFSREPRYFLSWEPPFLGKKISYAASCGSNLQPEGNAGKIGSWIRSFDFVSVRDDFSAQLIRQASGRKPEVVADPTLLVSPNSWIQVPARRPKKYFLLYLLGPSPAGLGPWMRRVQEQHGPGPWIWINGQADRISKPPPAEIKIWYASPGEWLGWMQRCQALLTDSFHAILFALQFQRPFFIPPTDSFRSPRLVDLAHRYDLARHRISSMESSGTGPLVMPSPGSTARIQSHVEQSLGFLRRALADH
jgi:hypothetical protein